MAIAITIPRLGWNMDEGVFVGWLKSDGDAVLPGDPLFSLEGEKATQDVESIDPGVLKVPPSAPKAGDKVPVGAVIGYLLQPGETDIVESATTAPAFSAVDPLRSPPPQPSPARGEGAIMPSPLAGEGWVGGAHQTEAVRPRRAPSTPLARRLARELGVDWTRLRGSGQGGRVRKVDVLEAARVTPSCPAPESPAHSLTISPIRRTIAARLVQSRQTTAPVTLTTTVDATNLVNLRRQFQEAGQVAPGFTDIVVKLTALALRAHPLLNARWADDRIELGDEAHIGIAVDTAAGLFVPVIRGAATLGLGQIAERARDLVRRARDNQLQPREMQGGTFTITNLGAFGIETFTPIINPPECAILGLGRIARQPMMDGDRVIPRERLPLSLTFDHRIVDGAPAARFLQSLGKSIENPAPWLIG